MKTQLDQDWQQWLDTNLARGCDRDELAGILFEHGFDPVLIVSALHRLPTSPQLVTAMNAALANAVPVTAAQSNDYAAIDAVNLPAAHRVATQRAHIYTLDNFLSEQECGELISMIRKQCRKSTLTNPDEPDKYFRTSKTCDLGLLGDAFVTSLDRRMADYMGIEPERSETLQGQYYQVGEQFKTHTDYFEPDSNEFEKFGGAAGQRTWTFMIYLNDVEAGGETVYPQLDLRVKPKRGTAVIWNSLLADGAVNPCTAHQATPVEKGEKFVITKWFRTWGSLQVPFKAIAHKRLPAITARGFEAATVPRQLMASLAAYYQTARPDAQPETSEAIGTYIHGAQNQHPANMLELDELHRQQVQQSVLPMLEAWAGIRLQSTAVYGIREYLRGATLSMHVDRINSHIISAIINVAQDAGCAWPLYIQDNLSQVHKVYLKPGEILFYESARLQHGRPEPLAGKYFANIFVHAAPL